MKAQNECFAASLPHPRAMQNDQGDEIGEVGVRRRLKHFTWAWFVATMSTGGLAIALGETPHQFKGMFLDIFSDTHVPSLIPSLTV